MNGRKVLPSEFRPKEPKVRSVNLVRPHDTIRKSLEYHVKRLKGTEHGKRVAGELLKLLQAMQGLDSMRVAIVLELIDAADGGFTYTLLNSLREVTHE